MADLAALLQPVTGAVGSGVLILLGLLAGPVEPMATLPLLFLIGWSLGLPASYPVATAILARDQRLRARRIAALRR